MKAGRLLSLGIACILLATLAVAANATPLAGPCAPGMAYDPACDVNRDGQITIADIQLTAGHWNQTGTWTGDNDHDHLGQTWLGNNNPLRLTGSYGPPYQAALLLNNSVSDGMTVESAGRDGVRVDSAGRYGVRVGTATDDGVIVVGAGNDGVAVTVAGGHGFSLQSAGETGLYVLSTVQDGVFVQTAGTTGVRISTAGVDGVHVRQAGTPSGYLDSSTNDGIEVEGAQGKGLFVGVADAQGVYVQKSGNDGVYVDRVGNPSSSTISAEKNGFEVAGAEGMGLYVGYSNSDGVQIRQTGDDGIQLGVGSSFPLYGLYVPPPGTPWTTLIPETANVNGEWALYTMDKIRAANVTMDAQTLLAVVGGDQPLTAGDVVTAMGLADPITGSLERLAAVGLAGGEASNVVGVVSSRMALQPLPGKDGQKELHSVDGPAQPGDYVAITVLGVAQAKVQAGEAIQPGQRLAVAREGRVRALQSRTVEGMVVVEGAPAIGVALAAPADGLMWVLVNPQ